MTRFFQSILFIGILILGSIMTNVSYAEERFICEKPAGYRYFFETNSLESDSKNTFSVILICYSPSGGQMGLVEKFLVESGKVYFSINGGEWGSVEENELQVNIVNAVADYMDEKKGKKQNTTTSAESIPDYPVDVPLDSRALTYFRSGIQNRNIMMSRDDFGSKWRFTAPPKCKRVGMGHVYALARMEENTDILIGIVEVDTAFQRLRFLEMYQDNMLYSNFAKIDESRYDTSWQTSDDPSATVNRYCSFLKEHYEEIPET